MFPSGRGDLRTRYVALSSGVTVRIVEAGDISAPAVLLVHGWGASSYMWRAWFAPLAKAGFRVIAPDLPGHGLSDKPDGEPLYTCPSLVSTLRELLDQERVQDVDVIAQSMAGTIAVALAECGAPRVRRLVLVNPALFGRVRLEHFFKFISPSVVDAFLPRLVRRWIVARTHRLVYGDPTRLTARDVDEYWAPSQFPGYARAMRRLLHVFSWKRESVHAMTSRLERITAPLMVILGTKDRLVLDARPYVAALRAKLPKIQVHEVQGGGHAVNEERPEELVPLVVSFLTGNE